MKNKLSNRAIHLLILIDGHTEKSDDGAVQLCWIPSSEDQYINPNRYDSAGKLPEGLVSLWVHGSDSVILRSLERKGLIERPRTRIRSDYVYVITEDGKCAIESYRSSEEK